MKIDSLILKNLHGYINKEINFNEDINLLVGINGSGKTSILNCIQWLLDPNIASLATTVFDQISLVAKNGADKIQITCQQKDSKLEIKLSVNQKLLTPLEVLLRKKPADIIVGSDDKADLMRHYASLRPTKEEEETWVYFTQKIKRPLAIGLSRYPYIPITRHNQMRRPDYPPLQEQEAEPVETVENIANSNFSLYRKKIIDLNHQLKDNLLLSLFDVATKSIEKKPVKVTFDQVETLRQKVEKHLIATNRSDTEKESANLKINEYFTRMLELLSKYQKDPRDPKLQQDYDSSQRDFRMLDDLLSAFNKYDEQSAAAHAQIKAYLDILNLFFTDCFKTITFNEDSNQISFHVCSADGKRIKAYQSIRHLSSGEFQLLLMFTHIALKGEGGQIMLIDEPELSLHPKWQEEFIPAVEKLIPKAMQLIVATHSPAIVGAYEKYCKILSPFNE